MVDATRLKNPTVIGLIGRAGCGKTTAAAWFVRNHTQVLHLSFASPIKAAVYEMIRTVAPKDAKSPTYYVNEGKEVPIPFLGGVTARRLMQTLGTEWGRNTISPDFWVGIAAQKLEARAGNFWARHTDTTMRAVFDDVRFQNEVDFIHLAGGIIVRIERPVDGRDAQVYEHTSEQQPLTADITLQNAGDVADFHALLATHWPPTVAPKKA